jgi:uncharacterized membrane protein YqjE
MEAHRVPTDPSTGITDLVQQLTADTKRLASDEIRLAKLEMRESVKRTGKGAIWLGVAFGVGVVMMVALTVLLSTLIGRLASGHMWVGALVTGLIELGLAAWLVITGVKSFAGPSYTLEATREELAETTRFVANPRAG